jgi:hypothetical protein
VEKRILDALELAIKFLKKNNYRYAVVGGLANAAWGMVRATRDVDIKVLIKDGRYEDFAEIAKKTFTPRELPVTSPLIVSVLTPSSVAVDFLLSIPGYESNIFERAVEHRLGPLKIWICSPEDLVIQKALANRDKDWLDIKGLLVEQMGKLDYPYIKDWLAQFAKAFDSPELLDRYLKLIDELKSNK